MTVVTNSDSGSRPTGRGLAVAPIPRASPYGESSILALLQTRQNFWNYCGHNFRNPQGSTKTVRLSFDQLKHWNKSLLSPSETTGKTLKVATLPPVSESYPFGKAMIAFHSTTMTKEGPKLIEVRQEDYVRLELAEPSTIVDVAATIRSALHFFDFVFGNPVHFSSIDAVVTTTHPIHGGMETRWSIFSALQKRSSISETVDAMNWQAVLAMRKQFGSLASAWDTLWSRFGDPIAVLYNTYYSETFVDTRFMNSVAFLDSYCTEFRGVKKRLDLHLLDLLNEHRQEIGPFVKMPLEDLSVRMAQTRNALAHLDARYSSFVDRSLSSLASCAFLLGECIIATELGVPPKIREDIVSGRIQRYRFDV
jgi:hypothetical protein